VTSNGEFPGRLILKSHIVISGPQIVTLIPDLFEIPNWNLKFYCSGVQISLRVMARAVSTSGGMNPR
jgi:hypothetical protein